MIPLGTKRSKMALSGAQGGHDGIVGGFDVHAVQLASAERLKGERRGVIALALRRNLLDM